MKLHHIFIPTKKNKFHPFALRSAGLIVFLAIFLAIPPIYNITTARQFRVLGYATSISVNDLNSISNQQRTSAGLQPLSLNTNLNNAAAAKAQDMFTDDYWAHIAPDGTTPWSFILAAGYNYSAAGENLAKDFDTANGVVSAWMGSEAHRENILNSDYQDVGYTVVNGTLQGEETTLVVAMYGKESTPVVYVASTDQSTNETTEVSNTASQSPVTTSVNSSDSIQESTDSTISDDKSTGKQITDKSDNLSSKGAVEGVSTSLPARIYNSLNWGQKTTILLICTMILLFVMKHTLIWREQKRGFRHIWLRSHPIGQALVLTAILAVTIISGIGVIL